MKKLLIFIFCAFAFMLNAQVSGGIVAYDVVDHFKQYNDTEYTSSNTFTVDTMWQTFPVNALSSYDRLNGFPEFYENGKLQAFALDGTYDVRFSFDGTSPTANNGVEMAIDIGGSLNIIAKGQGTFKDLPGTVESFTISIPTYQAATWQANGGTILIKSVSPCEIYNNSILVKR